MTVRIEKNGPVTTVIHSRAQARNAMDPDSAQQLHDAFVAFDADPDARVAVFWGEGGAFCAGWDLKHASSLAGRDDSLSEFAYADDPAAPVPRAAMGPSRLDLSKPVIAAIAGPAVAGGFELALWCDIRIMETSAYFGVYCRRWGIPLIDGGTVRLPRLVGQGRALEIILTGRKVPAEEALRIGACEQVVADGQSRLAAEAMARQIAGFPQQCMLADRRSVYCQHGLPLDQALRGEWKNALECCQVRVLQAPPGLRTARDVTAISVAPTRLNCPGLGRVVRAYASNDLRAASPETPQPDEARGPPGG